MSAGAAGVGWGCSYLKVLRLRDLLPRWITQGAGKLVPLRGTLPCFHDMTWQLTSPEQVIKETKMEAAVPFMAHPWKLDMGTAAASSQSQRLVVVHCGEVLHTDVSTRGYNHLSHLAGWLPQEASFCDKVSFELSLTVHIGLSGR